MSPQILFRSSGIALMVGSLFGLIWIIMSIILPVTDPNQFGSLLFLLVSLLMLLGSMLIVSGLVGMYARQAIPAGWLGLIGFILLFFGLLVFGVGFGLISTTVIPWLTTQAPNLIAGQLPPVLYVFLAIAIVMIAVGSMLSIPLLPQYPSQLLLYSLLSSGSRYGLARTSASVPCH